jgi:hypothetical protein
MTVPMKTTFLVRIPRTFSSLLPVAAGLWLLGPTDRAHSLPWYDQDPAIKPGIRDVGWVSTNPELTGGGGYCGYVAAANVLYYWAAHCHPTLVSGLAPDELMTDLIGSHNPDNPSFHRYLYQSGTIEGTTCNELETGLRNFITDAGYTDFRIKQYSTADITLGVLLRQQCVRD